MKSLSYPLVILHERSYGNFVQLSIKFQTGEVPVFISEQRPKEHPQIVSGILNFFEVPYEFIKEDTQKGVRIPSKEGEFYRVLGTGDSLRFNPENRLWIYSAQFSYVYSEGFNLEHFEQVRPFFPQGMGVELV